MMITAIMMRMNMAMIIIMTIIIRPGFVVSPVLITDLTIMTPCIRIWDIMIILITTPIMAEILS